MSKLIYGYCFNCGELIRLDLIRTTNIDGVQVVVCEDCFDKS